MPKKTKLVLSYDDLRTKKGIPYSRTHIKRLINEGKFPKPIKLSDWRRAFVEEEIDAWIAERIAERDEEVA